MARYQLPPGLSALEARAAAEAIDRYLGSQERRQAPWSLAGRVEACRLGAREVRRQSAKPWRDLLLGPYARRGTSSLRGRGDAK